MNTPAEYRADFDGLLAFEQSSPVRHECYNGRITTREDSSMAHININMNLMVAVSERLRGKPCNAIGSQLRVRTSETETNWYYPDLLIECPPCRFHPRDPDSLLNPHAIFEVLSPATEIFDRTGKFDEYQLIPEFSDYILVSADRVRVEHFRRVGEGEWALHIYRLLTQELHLENFDISVPLAEIYEDIEVGE